MNITWRKIKDKFVIKSNGISKSFTQSELEDLKLIIKDIESDKKEFYKKDNR